MISVRGFPLSLPSASLPHTHSLHSDKTGETLSVKRDNVPITKRCSSFIVTFYTTEWSRFYLYSSFSSLEPIPSIHFLSLRRFKSRTLCQFIAGFWWTDLHKSCCLQFTKSMGYFFLISVYRYHHGLVLFFLSFLILWSHVPLSGWRKPPWSHYGGRALLIFRDYWSAPWLYRELIMEQHCCSKQMGFQSSEKLKLVL